MPVQPFLCPFLCRFFPRPLPQLRQKLRQSLRGRDLFWQLVLLALLVGAAGFLLTTLFANLAARNVTTGFGFLHDEAGFAIGESLIAYTPADTFGRALVVGLLNTLRVALAGVVLATLLGLVVGLCRLAHNALVAAMARGYVELMRNIPLLLHLLFWYAVYTEAFPRPRQAWQPLAGVFVSNRGIHLPVPVHEAAAGWLGGWHWDLPLLQGFNFVGGWTLTPEFAALLTGLVLYTAAFTAEVVRAGILAVRPAQWQAGLALGLTRGQTLRRVVMPQALRVMVPPMTNQYLNLTKNSSLAVAIGYPDMVSIANTTIHQTGQAVEGILLIMAAYLSVSLGIALLMNVYNRRLTQRGQPESRDG